MNNAHAQELKANAKRNLLTREFEVKRGEMEATMDVIRKTAIRDFIQDVTDNEHSGYEESD